MSAPDFEQARGYALGRLEQELDPALCYHSVHHTRDDVAPAVERLAALEGVSGEELLLLRTAAYFHDIGFLVRREGHEAEGAAIAAAVLPGLGYGEAQVATVGRLILATRLPQQPGDRLAAILADGDLELLGRPDFLAANALLRAELAAFGEVYSDAEWYRGQSEFVAAHQYWTPSARRSCDALKAANHRALQQLLAAAEGQAPR